MMKISGLPSYTKEVITSPSRRLCGGTGVGVGVLVGEIHGTTAVVAAFVGLVVVNPLRWVPDGIARPRLALPRLASVTPLRQRAVPAALPALDLVPLAPLELSVSAGSTTWIQVWADGKLLAQQRLPRGVQERWTAKKRFHLIVAKPSQVELTLNNQSISPFAIAYQGRLAITHRGVTKLPDAD